MSTAWRSVSACVVCVLVGLALCAGAASAEGFSVSGGGASSFESSLVVPEAQVLLGGEAVSNAEEARRVSPEVVVARQESQTEYEGLGADEAARLTGEVFPGVVDHPGGGPPALPEGQHIASFTGANSAQVDLGEGKRAVLESLLPIATASGTPGHWSPVDLSVSEVGGGFRIANPVVGLGVPRRLQEGVSLAGTGVSLTPVNASGAVVGGAEGQVDGSVVFYGGVGVGRDVDEFVKPEIDGFSEDAILRSDASPERLSYRVGLPAGASLERGNEGSVEVVDGGSVLATILTPSAEDAEGSPVSLSMGFSGNVLTLTVAHGAEQAYPIRVDPQVTDKELAVSPGNWHFFTTNSQAFRYSPEKGQKLTYLKDTGAQVEYKNGQIGEWEYLTQGTSKIYEFVSTFTEYDYEPKTAIVNRVAIRRANGEKETGLSEITEPLTHTKTQHVNVRVCGDGCQEEAPHPIAAIFEQEAIESSKGNFESKLESAAVSIHQSQAPSANFDTTDATIGGEPNALLAGRWVNTKASPEIGLDARDQGIGVEKEGISSPNRAGWGFAFKNEARNECEGVQCNECYEPPCKGESGVSGNGEPLAYSLASAEDGELPEGEDTIEGKVEDATGLSKTASAKIKIDNKPPSITYFEGLPSNHELVDGQHVTLEAGAKSGPAGIASIVLDVDGQQVGNGQGSCSGSCTGNAVWTLSDENYAAGEHVLTVLATDNAGNVETFEAHMTVHHAEGVPVGPGSVNPVTGELSMAATDVSISVPGGALTVSRSYRSRHLAQGKEGPLGSQWNLSLGAEQSLSRVVGGMILTADNGAQTVFESKGKGEFTSPTGDAGLTLVEKPVEGKTVFTLSENGSVTTFELPTGGSGSVWMPSSVEGPNGTNMTLYKFKVVSGVTEPTEELALVPANVSCGKEISELKEGCRALKFEYDEGATTAKGEKASEWGEFAKHLSKVKYIAWNSSKTKTESVVAEYAYDTNGWLRAEWNPQITPLLLKTTYGYDSPEGHVTAVSTAGHEPQLLEPGTTPGDTNPGRLLAVAVPSAGTALGNGEAPGIKEIPTLSSTKPVVGAKISVNLTSEKTPGTWTANPLAFIYQWDDCNTSGKECSPIPGAVNQAYYPVAGDEGHTLVAKATAFNATGATTAETLATSAVGSGTPNTPLPEPPSVGSDAVTTLEYRVPVLGNGAPYEMSPTELAKWGQTDDPSEAMAVFPPDKVMGWPAKEYKRETVYYLDGKDRGVNTALPTGGISAIEYNLYNDIIRTLTPDNRLQAITEGCKPKEECKSATENTYEEKGTEPGTELLSTLGPQHTVKLAVGKEGKVNEEAVARERTDYYYNEGAPEGGPYHLVTKTIDFAETASKEEFDRRTTETSYSGQGGLGWKLRKPTSVIADPNGLDLVHTTEYNSSTGDVIETKMPAASGKDAKVPPTYTAKFGSKGSSAGQVSAPNGDAIDAHGNVWVADYSNNRIDEFSSSGTFIETVGFEVTTGGTNKFEICTSACKAGVAGGGEGQFSGPAGITVSGGTVYVADFNNDRVEEFNEKGEYKGKFGSKGTGAGQLEGPLAVAVASGGDVWVADVGNNRLDEFGSTGTFIEAIGFEVKTGGTDKFEICTSGCKAGAEGSGEGQFSDVRGVTISNGDVYATDYINYRVEEFGEKGEYIGKFGSKGTSAGQFLGPEGITTEPTSGNLYVTDWAGNRVQEFTPAGTYVVQFGLKGSGNGQLKSPEGVAVNSSNDVYVVDTGNNRIEEWAPTITGNEGAHDTKTIYYTTAANSEYKECGERPAMANLPCEIVPAAQPGTSGLPELPTTEYKSYSIWSEPETTVETVGSSTRTKTDTFDTAGRPETAAISSTVGEPLPTVTDEYNKETGALERQCANEGKPCTEGKPKTITSIDNRLGQLESYTDADENTTNYEYEKEKGARLKTINDQEGTETFEYNEANGLLNELTYTNGTSTKMTFTATYDAEENMLTETYPNGMTAIFTHNQVDKPTGVVYEKTTHCTEEEKEKCKWFKDTIVPSIHGQWLEQTSTLSHQSFTYSNSGSLTQVQNTPVGGKCTTRIYAYDEDINRTSLTTREPTSEGKCATEGGKAQEHKYDTADRLTDPGIAYNPFGDITTLPAADAEESAAHALTNTYYTDNQVASQTQNEQTIGYNLDPAGRTRETVSSGKPNNSTIISHYPGPSNEPAWTINPVSGEWRRNITGISGSLVAIQNNGETPELQLTNLHGDIIAKAYLSETATELAAKADTSEFGVPTVTAPAKYAWLGASELPTELPSGVVTMGVRSYVPQIGRFLQPDPIPGGSADAYTYTYGDPINSADPTGDYTNNGSTAIEQALSHEAEAAAAARQAAAEAAARAAAEKAAREAAEAAAAAAGPQYTEGEEWEEWEEEEGGYEEVAYHSGGQSAQKNSKVEGAILVTPLDGGPAESQAIGRDIGMPSCEAGSEGPCAQSVIAGSPCIPSGCHRKLYKHRVVKSRRNVPSGARRGSISQRGGAAIVGCAVGAVAGGTFAAFSSVGLTTAAGAYAGCFVVGGTVWLVEEIF